MEFKVFEDGSGAFVFFAPGSQETSDKFDLLVEAFKDGRVAEKRMRSICERMMREVPPLMQPYFIMSTLQLSKGKHERALVTAMRGLAAVNHLFPDDFKGAIQWIHSGNRPYLQLMKTILLCHVAADNHQKAAEWCQMIERIDPDDSCGTRFVMGHVLLRSEDRTQARDWFARHGDEYSPYWYELGLSLFEEGQLVEAATAFRRGIAVNPYIAELIFHGHEPNSFPVMHFWATEKPRVAAQYLSIYGKLWEESFEAQRFLYWLYNHSDVLLERARMMACREQRSLDTDLAPPQGQVTQYQLLLDAIDDQLSNAVVRMRPNGHGEMEWPWEVYVSSEEGFEV